MSPQITSRQNERIKIYKKLQQSPKERAALSQFTLEGMRLCLDAFQSGVVIRDFFYTSHAAHTYADVVETLIQSAENSWHIDDALAPYLADTEHPQGLFARCDALDKPLRIAKIGKDSKILALEDIRDPGNLGAIFRTAEAFGITGLILSPGCCDPYNPKALRGAMGALFRLPFWMTPDLRGTLEILRARGLTLAATVVSGLSARPVTDLAALGGTVAVIGNEGHGLSQPMRDFCDLHVTIPMSGRAESLGAAMAAGIVMWELTRRDLAE